MDTFAIEDFAAWADEWVRWTARLPRLATSAYGNEAVTLLFVLQLR